MIEKHQMNKMDEKGKRLSEYLNCQEWAQIELLDMLMAWDIEQAEYNSLIRWSDIAYQQFLKDLHKQPIDKSQL